MVRKQELLVPSLDRLFCCYRYDYQHAPTLSRLAATMASQFDGGGGSNSSVTALRSFGRVEMTLTSDDYDGAEAIVGQTGLWVLNQIETGQCRFYLINGVAQCEQQRRLDWGRDAVGPSSFNEKEAIENRWEGNSGQGLHDGFRVGFTSKRGGNSRSHLDKIWTFGIFVKTYECLFFSLPFRLQKKICQTAYLRRQGERARRLFCSLTQRVAETVSASPAASGREKETKTQKGISEGMHQYQRCCRSIRRGKAAMESQSRSKR